MHAVLTCTGELHPLAQLGEVAYGRDGSGAETSRWKAALWMAVGAVRGGGGSAKDFVQKAAEKVVYTGVSTDDVLRFALQERVQVLQCGVQNALYRFLTVKGDMRSEHHVFAA